MSEETLIPPDTLEAYRETEYHVFAEPTFTLRVDEASDELARLCAAHGARGSAFVTAHNPFSEEPEGASNEERQAALERELQERGLAYVPGIGQHPSGTPPGEPSFLVLGLTLEEARSLGEAYEQNAILFADETAIPRLVLLR
jgi:hypothetical protein